MSDWPQTEIEAEIDFLRRKCERLRYERDTAREEIIALRERLAEFAQLAQDGGIRFSHDDIYAALVRKDGLA